VTGRIGQNVRAPPSQLTPRRVPNRVERCIGDSLTPPRVRFAAAATVIVGCLLLVFSFATTRDNRAANGLGLGSDWLAFHNAATILNRYDASRLYDLGLQASLYHAALPGEPADASLPYANAPFLAVALRPLAMLPYAASYAAWLVISAMLFAGGLALIWPSSGPLHRYKPFAILLALSFVPFAIECLHGGQISAVGFFSICASIHFSRTGRPFTAGCLLAICIYKPTLLPIILPMLFVMRQWRTLVGFAIGASVLGAISLLAVGPHACLDYVHLLAGYAGKTSSAGAGGLQVFKFVDVNSFLKLLRVPSPIIWSVLLVMAAALAQQVWQIRPRNATDAARHLPLAWATAVSFTLVLNLYVGVYDSILVLPAIVLTVQALLRRATDTPRNLPLRFRCLLVVVWGLPWISGLIARDLSFQPYTIALLVLAVYQLRLWMRRAGDVPAQRWSGVERRHQFSSFSDVVADNPSDEPSCASTSDLDRAPVPVRAVVGARAG
jgi:hypothetical protein